MLFGLQTYILSVFRDKIWEIGFEESDIEAVISNLSIFHFSTGGSINSAAGLVALGLVCTGSFILFSSRSVNIRISIFSFNEGPELML